MELITKLNYQKRKTINKLKNHKRTANNNSTQHCCRNNNQTNEDVRTHTCLHSHLLHKSANQRKCIILCWCAVILRVILFKLADVIFTTSLISGGTSKQSDGTFTQIFIAKCELNLEDHLKYIICWNDIAWASDISFHTFCVDIFFCRSHLKKLTCSFTFCYMNSTRKLNI